MRLLRPFDFQPRSTAFLGRPTPLLALLKHAAGPKTLITPGSAFWGAGRWHTLPCTPSQAARSRRLTSASTGARSASRASPARGLYAVRRCSRFQGHTDQRDSSVLHHTRSKNPPGTCAGAALRGVESPADPHWLGPHRRVHPAL